MEQNNIDREIKKALGNRTILPTQEAKERLIELLLTSEKEKKQKPWLVWGIAASVCIALVVIGLNRRHNDFQNEKPQVTFENELETKKEEPQDFQKLKDKTTFKKEDENLDKFRDEDKLNKITNTKRAGISNVNTNKVGVSKNKKQLVKAQFSYVEAIKKEDIIINNEVPILDTMPSNLKKEYKYDYTEALLAEVMNDSNYQTKGSKTHSNIEYVNPDILLSRIESQIFLENNKNILERIGKHLKKIKEGVVNRNYE